MTPRIQRCSLQSDPDALPADWPRALRRVYAARGIASAAELDRRLERLHTREGLSGLEAAAELLAEAVTEDASIVIVGDFDADGATGTALAVRALQAMGARTVDYKVPNRFELGYGLTPELVELLRSQRPAVVVTVDNGIASIEGVAAARAAGMRVIVTDHHLPGERLPEADAIVNPNVPGDDFASKHLAGVGVVFYVMAALRGALAARGWFDGSRAQPRLSEYLDLVALGTVADLVPLDRNNRILVSQGIERIRAGRCTPGIRALLEVARRERRAAVAGDLAYAVAPRLNAAGRLDDMSVGIECLIADSHEHAQGLAQQLDALNSSRREIQATMQAQASATVEHLTATLDAGSLPYGLCLFEEDWHQGVVGLVASRIKERFHRPVIAFAPTGEASEALKGSARSVAGLHIRDALAELDVRYGGIIERFGGHAMAAGLSLARERLPAFREAFDDVVRGHLDATDLSGELWTDGGLAAEELTLDMARCLRDAGPWGQGFPPPIFDGVFDVADWRVVGDGHLKLRMRPAGASGAPVEAMLFRRGGAAPEPPATAVRAVYEPQVNCFRGEERLQLVIEHMEAAGE